MGSKKSALCHVTKEPYIFTQKSPMTQRWITPFRIMSFFRLNYKSLLQKRPMKKTIFCTRDLTMNKMFVYLIRVTLVLRKELCILTKRAPWLSDKRFRWKKPYILEKEPYILRKEFYILRKKPYILKKSRIFWQKEPHDSAINDSVEINSIFWKKSLISWEKNSIYWGKSLSDKKSPMTKRQMIPLQIMSPWATCNGLMIHVRNWFYEKSPVFWQKEPHNEAVRKRLARVSSPLRHGAFLSENTALFQNIRLCPQNIEFFSQDIGLFFQNIGWGFLKI